MTDDEAYLQLFSGPMSEACQKFRESIRSLVPPPILRPPNPFMSDLNDAQPENDPTLKEDWRLAMTAEPGTMYEHCVVDCRCFDCQQLRRAAHRDGYAYPKNYLALSTVPPEYQEDYSPSLEGSASTKVSNSAGAYRSETKPKYSLIPLSALKRLAVVLTEGSLKYGEYNWENGLGIRPTLDHAIEHIYLYLAGDRSEDHLGHAFCNLAFCIESQEKWPHLNTDLRPVCEKPSKSANET